ncbi:MAG: hypothetical protein V1855_05060 [bacterium]
MSYKRQIFPSSFPSGDALTQKMIGLGFRLAGTPFFNANIEDVLLGASLEGLQDLRVLSLLIDWIDIHYQHINADRLIQLIKKNTRTQPPIFHLFWHAMAQRLPDSRFLKLKKITPRIRTDFPEKHTEFLVDRNGEDLRFQKTCLRIPNKFLRHRPEDILSPGELARIHIAYRFRVFLGPSYRADMWANQILMPNLSASELARTSYGSYPTAHLIKHNASTLGEFLARFAG